MENKKIYIAGHKGLVGSAIVRKFKSKGYNLLLKTKEELNLIDKLKVEQFFEYEKPDIVILAAGKVGGIGANKKYPADFLYENTLIWSNVINAAAKNNVEKLIFLGSATVYPLNAAVPFKEESIFTGELDENTKGYAYAKQFALTFCEQLSKSEGLNFYTLTLANLYGPNDHFDNDGAHVVPSLISKIYKAKTENAKEVILWGTGKPTRDLLFVDDLAAAIEFSINNIEARMIYEQGISHLNVGTGEEYTINEIANYIKEELGYTGEINYDSTKPDGMMRKSIDTSKLESFGWSAETNLKEGVRKTCDYYINLKNNTK